MKFTQEIVGKRLLVADSWSYFTRRLSVERSVLYPYDRAEITVVELSPDFQYAKVIGLPGTFGQQTAWIRDSQVKLLAILTKEA